MSKIPGAIKVLIIINVIFFGVTQVLGDSLDGFMVKTFAMWFPQHPNFQYWQIVTSMFMHGGVLHILLNMYGLWAFGSPLELMWKKDRFLTFYFAAGIGASLIFLAVNYFQFTMLSNELMAIGVKASDIHQAVLTGKYNPTDMLSGVADKSVTVAVLEQKLSTLWELFSNPALGASGAIYGILVAFGMSFPNAKLALIFLPVPIPAKYFIPVLIGIDLFSGVTGFSIFGGSIAHFAHVGGALVGFLLLWYWKVRGVVTLPVRYE
ncbi:MAG: rhomboid family intramembrane serine protease [Cyclobacteriaceae bacterium]